VWEQEQSQYRPSAVVQNVQRKSVDIRRGDAGAAEDRIAANHHGAKRALVGNLVDAARLLAGLSGGRGNAAHAAGVA